MQEQEGEERSVAKSKSTAMNLSSHVPTSSSSAESPIDSISPGALKATVKPESRMRRNSKSDAASSSRARLKDAYLGGWTQPRGNLSLQKRNQEMWTFPNLKLGEDVTGKPVAYKTATRVSSHSSPYGSSLLDRKEDLRTRTHGQRRELGREYGYLEHISDCHSSSGSSSWQDYEVDSRHVKNNLWNSVGQLFNETGKLMGEQTEITGVRTKNQSFYVDADKLIVRKSLSVHQRQNLRLLRFCALRGKNGR